MSIPTRCLRAAPAVALMALAGCSTEIDAAKGEKLIRKAVTVQVGARVRHVSCPKGLTAKKGATFRCKVTGADGTTGDAIVTEHDDKGAVSVRAPFLHVREVEASIAADLERKVGDRVRISCPEIIIVAKGGRFTCRGRSGKDKARIRVVQQDARGHVRYSIVG